MSISKTGQSRNAYFEYNGDRFDVEVTKLSYSWNLQSKGTSQSKQGYTIYPYRYEQSPLTASLIFETPDRYTEFRRFIYRYHMDITSRSGATPAMYFRGNDGIMDDDTGYRQSHGFNYEVTIESVPFRYSYNMVAPEMTLKLAIVSNYDNMNSTDSGSSMIGSETDLVTKVTNGSSDSDYATD